MPHSPLENKADKWGAAFLLAMQGYNRRSPDSSTNGGRNEWPLTEILGANIKEGVLRDESIGGWLSRPATTRQGRKTVHCIQIISRGKANGWLGFCPAWHRPSSVAGGFSIHADAFSSTVPTLTFQAVLKVSL